MHTRFAPYLGTLLRRLTDQLDGAVEEQYAAAGLAYRARFTPVVRALLTLRSASIKEIAVHAGLTHSATSQTVAQMTKGGLVRQTPGVDARTRMVALTPRALAMAPRLERMWETTNRAAAQLEGEQPYPLSVLLHETLDALERESFFERIEHTAREIKRDAPSAKRTTTSAARHLSGRRR